MCDATTATCPGCGGVLTVEGGPTLLRVTDAGGRGRVVDASAISSMLDEGEGIIAIQERSGIFHPVRGQLEVLHDVWARAVGAFVTDLRKDA